MNSSSQALIRQIVAHVTCAVCGHHFGVSDILVLGRRDEQWALRVYCRECRAQALILATMNDTGGADPVYTDLLPDEWDRFKDAKPIKIDDVITVHDFMCSYQGDFSDILEDPLPGNAED